MAKKTKTIETPKVDAKAEITYAINRLAYFKEKRGAATTPEELADFTFWTDHWTKVVADLKSK